jgi:hypothetical protein
MGRLFDILMALGCFALISALWLAALGLLTSVLMQSVYAFNPLDLAAWQSLAAGFRQGGAVPLGFFLTIAAALLLASTGEIAILWRLPGIAAAMPVPHLPHLAWPRLRAPVLARPKAARPRAEPLMPPPPSPPPPPAPSPPSASPADRPAEAAPAADSVVLARILALFEVWNEPPPAWMAEALRDEIVLLSPDAWPTLESLGSQGLDLLVTLQAHGMLPESPAALRAIGEVETVLRAGIATGLEAGAEPATPLPIVTLAASWLCEALENFLAAQADPLVPPERLAMAQTMFGQALRGMTDADWTSLDQFPEKAGRVRVLTDRLREDLRRPIIGKPAPAPSPATPVETIITLLKQFGFALEAASPGADQGTLLAEREDLILLLHAFDLGGGDWHLPQGLLGPWAMDGARLSPSPGRQLWQQMARRRLRRPDPRPLAGLLVLHGGRLEQEELLAGIVAVDRRRSGIGLAWLTNNPGALPSLQDELTDLRDRALKERQRERSADYSTASP